MMNTERVFLDKRHVMRGIVFTLVVNGLLPLMVYELLRNSMSSLGALSIATCIPLLDNLLQLLKYRRVDIFAGFMLIGFVLSLGAVLLGGNERLILIRESFVTGILGLFFFASLFFPKPLIYHFALRFTVGKDPSQVASFATNWHYPYFRFVVRIMTLVWGVALVGEACVRAILVFRLTVTEFLAVSNFVLYGFIGAAIVWTVWYRRYSKKRLEKIKRGVKYGNTENFL
jgi:hypothetical protein